MNMAKHYYQILFKYGEHNIIYGELKHFFEAKKYYFTILNHLLLNYLNQDINPSIQKEQLVLLKKASDRDYIGTELITGNLRELIEDPNEYIKICKLQNVNYKILKKMVPSIGD